MNPGIGFPDEFEDRRKVSVEKYVCRGGGRGAEEGCGADGGIGRRRGTRARRRSRGRSRRRNMVGRSRWVLLVEAGELEREDRGCVGGKERWEGVRVLYTAREDRGFFSQGASERCGVAVRCEVGWVLVGEICWIGDWGGL